MLTYLQTNIYPSECGNAAVEFLERYSFVAWMGCLMQRDVLDDQLFRENDHIGLSQVLQILTLHSQIKT
jgi:hypothetical protein